MHHLTQYDFRGREENNLHVRRKRKRQCAIYEHASDMYIVIRSVIHDNDVHHFFRNDLDERLWFVNNVDLNTTPVDDAEDFSD